MERLHWLLCSAFVAALVAPGLAAFGEFNLYEDHPLRSTLTDNNIPVVLNKYYLTTSSGPNSDLRIINPLTKFLPGAAKYREGGSDYFKYEDVDAFMVRMNWFHQLTIKLNYNAKVIVIVNHMSGADLSNPITGPDGWTAEGMLYAEGHRGVRAPNTGDRDLGLLDEGFAFSGQPVQNGRTWDIVLPKPREFNIGGFESRKPSAYTILFVDVDNGAFPYPNRQPTGVTERIEPNSRCPEELHDMWVTYSKDMEDPDNYIGGVIPSENKRSAMIKRSTWHPLVDPIYWCTYGHDHGSFPGRYKPAFSHTAWKTADAEGTADGRQIESNEGFKVFTMFEAELHWIFVVHFHLSDQRRFSTRHHTTQLAIFDSEWKGLAFLNLKQDFGFATTRVEYKEAVIPKCGGNARKTDLVPLTADEDIIKWELKQKGTFAFRQFNLRGKENCLFENDENVLKIQTTPNNDDKGNAEHWRASFATCTNKLGFQLDVSRPHTGLKSCTTSGADVVDQLDGESISRAFSPIGSRGFEVGAHLCSFDEPLPDSATARPLEIPTLPGGATLPETMPMIKFYTDSYLTRLEDGPHRTHLAQWMVPDLNVALPQARYKAVNPWHGKFVPRKSPGHKGNFANLDNLLYPEEN